MANSSTLMATVSDRPALKSRIRENKVVLDTINADLVVHTPAAGYSVYLKSIFGSELTAANLRFKQRSAALAGTVATTSGSAAVTGTGTAFTTDYVPGQEIVIDAAGTEKVYTVSSIASNTSMTLSANASATVTGKTHQKQLTIVTPELGANQGMLNLVQPDCWILATRSGYALVVSASAAVSELLLNTQEGKSA